MILVKTTKDGKVSQLVSGSKKDLKTVLKACIILHKENDDLEVLKNDKDSTELQTKEGKWEVGYVIADNWIKEGSLALIKPNENE